MVNQSLHRPRLTLVMISTDMVNVSDLLPGRGVEEDAIALQRSEHATRRPGEAGGRDGREDLRPAAGASLTAGRAGDRRTA